MLDHLLYLLLDPGKAEGCRSLHRREVDGGLRELEYDVLVCRCAAVLTYGAQTRTLRSKPGRQASGAGLRLAARQHSRHLSRRKTHLRR